MLKHWWQFLLDMVNISGILPYKIPKYTLTYAIYFDWRSTILWLRNVLKQYFNDWFVSFKQQDDNFSKTEKILYHNKHVRDNTFMTSIWKAEGRGGGGVLRFIACLQILLFLNKRSIVHFCGWRGWSGGHIIDNFLWPS